MKFGGDVGGGLAGELGGGTAAGGAGAELVGRDGETIHWELGSTRCSNILREQYLRPIPFLRVRIDWESPHRIDKSLPCQRFAANSVSLDGSGADVVSHNPLRHRGSEFDSLQRCVVEQSVRNTVRCVSVRGSQVNSAWMRRKRVRAYNL